MVGSTGGRAGRGLVMSLVVDTVSWRHPWDIKGGLQWLCVQAWSLGRRSELGWQFLALFPLNICPVARQPGSEHVRAHGAD